jgi:hypothetical protein
LLALRFIRLPVSEVAGLRLGDAHRFPVHDCARVETIARRTRERPTAHHDQAMFLSAFRSAKIE